MTTHVKGPIGRYCIVNIYLHFSELYNLRPQKKSHFFNLANVHILKLISNSKNFVVESVQENNNVNYIFQKFIMTSVLIKN